MGSQQIEIAWSHAQYSPVLLLLASLAWSCIVAGLCFILRRKRIRHFGIWLALGFASWLIPGLIIVPSMEFITGYHSICFGDPSVFHFVAWFLPPSIVVAMTPAKSRDTVSPAP